VRSLGGPPMVRAEAPGKVREVGHHRAGGATVGQRKWPQAATFIGGRVVRWSPVAGGSPCTSGEERGK
jgi:hypothetical protein